MLIRSLLGNKRKGKVGWREGKGGGGASSALEGVSAVRRGETKQQFVY
jgi:hypothetical protein